MLVGVRFCFWIKGGCGWGGDVGLYLRFYLMRVFCNRVSFYFLIFFYLRKDWGGYVGFICVFVFLVRYLLCCFCFFSGIRVICCIFFRVVG